MRLCSGSAPLRVDYVHQLTPAVCSAQPHLAGLLDSWNSVTEQFPDFPLHF